MTPLHKLALAAALAIAAAAPALAGDAETQTQQERNMYLYTPDARLRVPDAQERQAYPYAAQTPGTEAQAYVPPRPHRSRVRTQDRY